jgi:hypothetical protein
MVVMEIFGLRVAAGKSVEETNYLIYFFPVAL